MNRAEIRDAALSRESWHADYDSTFLEKVNKALSRCYRRLCAEVPSAILPSDEHLQVLQDHTQTTLGRTVATTTDDWVLDLGDAALSGATAVVVDGTWDGIYHIEVTYNGTVYRRRCLEFWEHKTAGPYLNHYLVSIDRPINFSGSGLSFRLHQPFVYPRSDVQTILDGNLWDQNRSPIMKLPSGFFYYNYHTDFRGERTGRPQALARCVREQMAAPSRTPAVGAAAVTNWVDGQEAPGTFKYRYTFVWGKRHEERQSPRGAFDPMFESAPSPESASITVAAVGSDAVVVTLPNIAWEKGFDPEPAELRNGRSGLRVRVYRARTAATASGTTEHLVEADGVYYFLAEVGDSEKTFTDDGSYIPDYDRRLPESHGHWGWTFAPHQDETYELDLRVLRHPRMLLTDYDVPHIDPQFSGALIALLCKELAVMNKDATAAQTYEAEYESEKMTLTAEAAGSSDYVPAQPWCPPMTVNIYGDDFYGPFFNTP